MECILNHGDFTLTISWNVYESDLNFPVNTTACISVSDRNFSCRASMDLNAEGAAMFSKDLSSLYKNLSGKAVLRQPYGSEMFISFEACPHGHICIKGRLDMLNDRDSCSIEFTKTVDETSLKSFSLENEAFLSKYL